MLTAPSPAQTKPRRNRRLLLMLFAASAVLAVGYAALWLAAPARVTQNGSELIKKGMTETELRALMRYPPADYRSQPEPQPAVADPWMRPMRSIREWIDD